MIVATARPEFLEGHPDSGRGGSPATAISLSPLTDTQGTELVERLLTVADLPAPLRADILAKAEGNPFFVEEIVRRLIDEGVLVQEGDHWRATSPAVRPPFPTASTRCWPPASTRWQPGPAGPAGSRGDRPRVLGRRRGARDPGQRGRRFAGGAGTQGPGGGAADDHPQRAGGVRLPARAGARRGVLQPSEGQAGAGPCRGRRLDLGAGRGTSRRVRRAGRLSLQTAIAGEDADLAWLDDAGEREACVPRRTIRCLLPGVSRVASTRSIARWSCMSGRWRWQRMTTRALDASSSRPGPRPGLPRRAGPGRLPSAIDLPGRIRRRQLASPDWHAAPAR